MAMTMVLETEGGISEFLMKPIDRKTGRRVTKKLAVDAQGRACTRALITHDNLLLPSGAVTDLYEDGDGNTVEHGEVIRTDDSGNGPAEHADDAWQAPEAHRTGPGR